MKFECEGLEKRSRKLILQKGSISYVTVHQIIKALRYRQTENNKCKWYINSKICKTIRIDKSIQRYQLEPLISNLHVNTNPLLESGVEFHKPRSRNVIWTRRYVYMYSIYNQLKWSFFHEIKGFNVLIAWYINQASEIHSINTENHSHTFIYIQIYVYTCNIHTWTHVHRHRL